MAASLGVGEAPGSSEWRRSSHQGGSASGSGADRSGVWARTSPADPGGQLAEGWKPRGTSQPPRKLDQQSTVLIQSPTCISSALASSCLLGGFSCCPPTRPRTRRPIPAPRAHELEGTRWAWRPTPSVALARGPSKLSRVLVAHRTQPPHLASLLVHLVLCAWATGGWEALHEGPGGLQPTSPRGPADRLLSLSFSKPSEEFLNGADFLTSWLERASWARGRGVAGTLLPQPPTGWSKSWPPLSDRAPRFPSPSCPGYLAKGTPNNLLTQGTENLVRDLGGAAHLRLPVFVWVEIIRPISL